MISEAESEKLKKRIGGNYLAKISMHFTGQNIFNKFDEPFSTSYLSRVINGKQPNKKVEDGMLDLVRKINEEEELEAERRAAILEPQNTSDHV